jgi:hypothetical protein
LYQEELDIQTPAESAFLGQLHQLHQYLMSMGEIPEALHHFSEKHSVLLGAKALLQAPKECRDSPLNIQ